MHIFKISWIFVLVELQCCRVGCIWGNKGDVEQVRCNALKSNPALFGRNLLILVLYVRRLVRITMMTMDGDHHDHDDDDYDDDHDDHHDDDDDDHDDDDDDDDNDDNERL